MASNKISGYPHSLYNLKLNFNISKNTNNYRRWAEKCIFVLIYYNIVKKERSILY